MKYLRTLLVLVMATLTSCNRVEIDGIDNVSGDDVIMFTCADDGLQTKAITESTLTLVRTNGFRVAAVAPNNVVVFNEDADYVAAKSAWCTGGEYFWPVNIPLRFYAAYPKTGIAVSSGVATLPYTSDGNTDLLAAWAEGSRPAVEGTPQSLTFNHVLSQFDFTVRGSNSEVWYRIKKVTVSSPASGTYRFTTDAWTRGASSDRTFYDGSLDVSTTAASGFGTVMTLIPGEVTVTIAYDVLDDSKTVLLASYTKKAVTTITKGKKTTVNATLPFQDEMKITLTMSITPWGTQNHTGVEFTD